MLRLALLTTLFLGLLAAPTTTMIDARRVHHREHQHRHHHPSAVTMSESLSSITEQLAEIQTELTADIRHMDATQEQEEDEEEGFGQEEEENVGEAEMDEANLDDIETDRVVSPRRRAVRRRPATRHQPRRPRGLPQSTGKTPTVAANLPPASSPTIPTLVDFTGMAPRHDVTAPLPPRTLPPQYHWQQPNLRTRSRSPCPMLNTLANHGMLPRDGRNISAGLFADTLKRFLNVQWDFWWVIAQTAIMTVKPGQNSIDLHDLAFHNGIQHDAALTRNDMGQGQFFTRANATLVKQLLAMNHGGPLSYLEMARARRLREGQSAAWNAHYSLPGQNLDSIAANKWFLGLDQAAVPLLVLSDNIPGQKANTGVVPIDRLHTFFTYERLPYENGWIPSQYELTMQQVYDGIRKVANLYVTGPDTVESPIGLSLTAGGPPTNPHPDY